MTAVARSLIKVEGGAEIQVAVVEAKRAWPRGHGSPHPGRPGSGAPPISSRSSRLKWAAMAKPPPLFSKPGSLKRWHVMLAQHAHLQARHPPHTCVCGGVPPLPTGPRMEPAPPPTGPWLEKGWDHCSKWFNSAKLIADSDWLYSSHIFTAKSKQEREA